MATVSSGSPWKKKETSLPPKRGQIKARIFESLAKAVVSMLSRSPEISETGGTSAPPTPPPSDYNSDGA